MNQSENKRLIVCMAEEMPLDESSAQPGIALGPSAPGIIPRLTQVNVLRYKGLEVSEYHHPLDDFYAGTWVN